MFESRDDPALVIDAMAYVDEVHRALTAENTAPPPGIAGRVVAAILADPTLAAYVRRWAEERRVLEASLKPFEPPPFDAAWQRVAAMLKSEEAVR
jgi:hypothetical protein